MNTNKKNFLIVTLKEWNFKNFAKIKKKNFFLIKRRKDFTLSKIKKINPRFIFFPHWSFKIKSSIINNFTCIGFHETNLPYGRGGSPIQNLIIRNKNKTKITAFVMNNFLDEGDIVIRKDLSLSGSAQNIYSRSSDLIFEMIKNIAYKKKLKTFKQRGKVTYFKRLKNNSIISSKDLNLKTLYNKIRMLDANTYERAYMLFSKKIKMQYSDAKLKNNRLYCKVVIKKIND